MRTPEDAGPPALSVRRQSILTAIRECIEQRGYPPSVREIAATVGLGSTSSVDHHLKVLERQGLLRRVARGPRAVDIRPAVGAGITSRSGNPPGVVVPLLGTIAAGVPISAERVPEYELMLPPELVGGGTLFALRVKGDSMVEAAICDRDIVVVREQSVAQNGDIVAAVIDDEVTVKVYRNRDGHVELVPRNPRYEVINADNATILGKVVSVLRRI